MGRPGPASAPTATPHLLVLRNLRQGSQDLPTACPGCLHGNLTMRPQGKARLPHLWQGQFGALATKEAAHSPPLTPEKPATVRFQGQGQESARPLWARRKGFQKASCTRGGRTVWTGCCLLLLTSVLPSVVGQGPFREEADGTRNPGLCSPIGFDSGPLLLFGCVSPSVRLCFLRHKMGLTKLGSSVHCAPVSQHVERLRREVCKLEP